MTLRTTIDQTIKGSNRTITVLSVLAILAGIIGFVGVGNGIPPQFVSMFGTSKYVLAYIKPPTVLTSAQVSKITVDQLPLYNVQVVADVVYNLGGESYEYETGKSGDKVINYYGILQVQGGDVLLRAPVIANEQQLAYTGILRVSYESVAVDLYNEFAAEYAQQGAHLYPFVLDASENALLWLVPAGVELALVVGGAIGIGMAFTRSNHNEHPIMKRLARYGDIEATVEAIDNEMVTQVKKVHKFQFTRRWLIYQAGYDMHFVKLEDVMWIYKYVVKRRNRGITSTTYSLYLFDRSGHRLDVTDKNAAIDEMIAMVMKRAPWAVAGHSKDTENMWSQEREYFTHSVDERRARIIAQAKQARASESL